MIYKIAINYAWNGNKMGIKLYWCFLWWKLMKNVYLIAIKLALWIFWMNFLHACNLYLYYISITVAALYRFNFSLFFFILIIIRYNCHLIITHRLCIKDYFEGSQGSVKIIISYIFDQCVQIQCRDAATIKIK